MEIVISTQLEGQPHPPVQSNQRSKTDIAWKYVSEAQDEAGKKSLVCAFCQKVFRGGGINRMKQHLAGVKGNVASCVNVPEDVKLLMQGVLEEKSQKTKGMPSVFVVHNLDGNEGVEAQTINPPMVHAIEGKKKASSNLQLTSKRVDGDGDDDEALPPGIRVLEFDDSIEDYFKVVDKIALLSGESELEYEQTEIQRLSSSVTFLSKWRDFCYQPQAIRFACEKETSLEKDISTQINLPQFSSAAVPKDISQGNETSSPLSKDFVMYVGGPIWALDWCPRVHPSSAFDTNVEFIAVSAHPPESVYHKIGAPLTGRGLIQIWCILNTGQSQQVEIPLVKVKRKSSAVIDPTKPKKPRGRPRKYPKKESDGSDHLMQDSPGQSPESSKKVKSHKPKRPRGRPRKEPIKNLSNNFDSSRESLTEFTNDSPRTSPEPLAVAFPDESTKFAAKDKFTLYNCEFLAKEQVTKKNSEVYNRMPRNDNEDHSAKSKTYSKSKLTKDGSSKKSQFKGVDPPILSQNCDSPLDKDDVSTGLVLGQAHIKDHLAKSSSKTSKPRVTKLQARRKSEEKGAESPPLSQKCECPLDQDEVLPRFVMGMAHNGKVAWDVKWRPFDTRSASKHIMGYLAVLLGNGALEVWEVPNPHVTKAIFSSNKKEGNDPRFLKLKPVFLCSKLKCGDRQSVPLTLEWSASAPHDLILAGCHDGVVAMWKFSASSSSKDTRPLLCFNADTVPIRALKWAPLASDPESANTIVTAGHKGLKFWDIRDPFHPLWDISFQKIINSLDWLPDPSCVVLSCDDGEIKIISLLKAANDAPVTGMPTDKKPQHGSHSYYCSLSSIWSVQVSRLTSMVVYSCSDGKVINFQLTAKAVEKDPLRNRVPHYLCGSLTEEDSSLTVLSPLPYIPIPMMKSSTEYGDTPRSSRGVKSRLNQEKRAKEQISNSQTPPKQSSELCSEGAKVMSQKNNNDTLMETQTQTSQALVCIDNENNVEEEVFKATHNNKAEIFPPKIVAMHRATWNMNKGSERLVCYGGAAGILRCQEIRKFAAS